MIESSSMNYRQPFIGVDWGTTNFRAYLIGKSGELISETGKACNLANTTKESQAALLIEQVDSLKTEFYVENNKQIPVLITGMAGSSLGLKNTEYLSLDTSLYQLYQKVESVIISGVTAFIVPGFSGVSKLSEFEAMRGEETQILGWMLEQDKYHSSKKNSNQPTWLCLPGTHTKWVAFRDGKIRIFNTVPTGEVFANLSRETSFCIGEQVKDLEAFSQGIKRTLNGERFNEIVFSTRTKVLSGSLKEESAASYLSGILIGTEIFSQMCRGEFDSVQIIGSESLNELYQTAFDLFDVSYECYSSESLVRSAMSYMMSQLVLSEQLSTKMGVKEV